MPSSVDGNSGEIWSSVEPFREAPPREKLVVAIPLVDELLSRGA